MPRFAPLALCSALLALAATAYAAPVTTFKVHKRNLRGQKHFTDARMNHRSLGIQGFSMKFTGPPQKVGALGFWPAGGRFHTVLKNRGNNAAYDSEVHYAKLPLSGAEYRQVAKRRGCLGSCRVRLAAPPKGNWVFVLSGYKFTNTGKQETEIQQIKVRPNIRGRYADVAFKNAGRSKFDVELTYYYLVRGAFKHVGTTHGETKKGTSNAHIFYTDDKKLKGRGLVRGFDFKFVKGDHALKEFSIQPTEHGRTSQNGFFVRLLTRSANTQSNFVVDYAVLNENWASRARN